MVEDARFGQLTALIANVHRSKGKRAVKMSDAMFGEQAEAEPLTPLELKAKVLAKFGRTPTGEMRDE